MDLPNENGMLYSVLAIALLVEVIVQAFLGRFNILVKKPNLFVKSGPSFSSGHVCLQIAVSLERAIAVFILTPVRPTTSTSTRIIADTHEQVAL